MKDFEKRLLNLITYVAILIIVLLIVGYKSFGNVDGAALLSFLGALVGALITLVGVLFTINASFEGIKLSIQKQERQDFLDNAPKKIRILHSINKKLNQLSDEIMLNNDNNFTNINTEKIEAIINNLLDESSQVNATTFNVIEDLEPHLTLYFIPEYKKLIGVDERGFPKLTDQNKYTKLCKDSIKKVDEAIEKISSLKIKIKQDYNTEQFNKIRE
ncbi:hypothetical protein [Oceanobacillus saliphilus]|uniref:hypothetical protein n=1 Tax=Oceanobacillus saliphilus TaxID=2925834 RepID=UPI00201D4285|nr:hypothetical protein [Oceanobacillus saliphilus]